MNAAVPTFVMKSRTSYFQGVMFLPRISLALGFVAVSHTEMKDLISLRIRARC